MIEKSVSELTFVQSNESVSTVELDLDSIPEELCGYGDFVVQALQEYANNAPEARLTIYVYQGQSINFAKLTFSAFFCVVGQSNEKLLEILLNAFQKTDCVNARYGDCIDPSTGICEFHIEDGSVWRPSDEVTWYSEVAANHEVDESDKNKEPGCILAEEECVNETDVISTEKTRVSYPSRFRSARADASLGSIQRKIEDVFGLPEGSVALRGPDGKALRSDAQIGTLRRRWE